MHPKSADFGKICSPCMQNALQNAVGECISRVSCHEDPLFPSASLESCTVGKSCHSFSACLSCGSSGRDRHRGSTFTGILACPLREGANAVACPLCGGGASIAVRPSLGSSVVVHPLLGHQRCGSSSTRRCKRCGSSLMWGYRCCGSPFARECQRGKKKTARRRKAPSLARPSRSAFLSGKSWRYFVAMNFPKGHIGAATESYRAGNAITNTAPPSGALNAVTVPSKLSTISFTMASPRPAPPLLRAREASLR